MINGLLQVRSDFSTQRSTFAFPLTDHYSRLFISLKNVKWALLGLVFLLPEAKLQAQHQAMYSQYMFNTLMINPAYTGSRDVLSLSALYRHQWTGFTGAPRTQTFAAHFPLRNEKNNFGVSFINDRLGVSYNNSFSGYYAFRFPLAGGRLAFGLQGGVALLQDRWSEVVTTQTNDPSFMANSPTYVVPRIGFGAYYDTRKFYVGFSAPHLVDFQNPEYSQYVQNSVDYQPYFFAAGFVTKINPYLKLKPSVLIKVITNSPLQADLNANLIIKDALWIGASYRSGDALVGILEYQINPQFRMGYSYDYTLSDLSRYNTGTHEFMLRYEFGYKIKAMSPRYF